MSGYVPTKRIDRLTRKHMQGVVEPFATIADKIRALAAAGYDVVTIAAFLTVRYQHAYNVLKGAAPMRSAAPQPTQGFAEPAASARDWNVGEDDMSLTCGSVVIDDNGRIALPPKVIAALDAEPGRPVPWRFEDGELKLMNREAGLRFAQAMVAEAKKQHPGSWSDALIAERRAEAAGEDERYEGRRRG